MKKSLAPWRRTLAALGILATGTLLVACSSADAGGSTNSDTKSVVFVTPQKAGDNGPVDDMIAALDRLKADFPVETKYVELSDPSTYESTLRNLGQAGTDYIVTAFPGMQQPIQAVAPDFPDSDFLLIFGDEFTPALDNARAVSYDIYQAMYVAGVAAAHATTSGKIGYIGGAVQPALNADLHAFEEGAKSVTPTIEVANAFVGSFDDSAKGRDVAASMISTGVDVIQSDAAAASLGVVNAAEKAGTYVIADSSGEVAAQFPQTIIGTTFLEFGESLYQELSAALTDGFEPGFATSGLADGIVGLKLSDSFLSGTSPIAATMTELQPLLKSTAADIASGTITVTFDPSNS